jgi:hypothetical protein
MYLDDEKAAILGDGKEFLNEIRENTKANVKFKAEVDIVLKAVDHLLAFWNDGKGYNKDEDGKLLAGKFTILIPKKIINGHKALLAMLNFAKDDEFANYNVVLKKISHLTKVFEHVLKEHKRLMPQ